MSRNQKPVPLLKNHHAPNTFGSVGMSLGGAFRMTKDQVIVQI